MTNDYGNLELHKVLLAAMKDIDKICRENGLRYYLYAGTLLGAMNHKGFIPWDDDVDISMFPSDFEVLCKIIARDYSEKYFVETYKNTSSHYSMMPKIRLIGTEITYDNGEKEPIFIDLSIFHSVPDMRLLRLIQKKRLMLWDKVNSVKSGAIIPSSLVSKLTIGLLARKSKESIELKLQRIMNRYDNNQNTELIALMIHMLPNPYTGVDGYTNDTIPRKWCDKPSKVLFEDSFFMAYEHPELDLIKRYGDDYAKPYPEEKRKTKHGVVKYAVNDRIV